jgi:hypothetical protein
MRLLSEGNKYLAFYREKFILNLGIQYDVIED